jgi:beta-lactam-binding protein with PASTA domain/tRNA A-37 threonylcarbamoyl transferase component Bud32
VEEIVFGQRYRTIEKIGAGGMADVYKAMDEVLGRTVAIKVMHAHFAADPAFVQRFRHEAQAAANLSHPNIVNIYDWGQQTGTYYIVMEYVRGTDLKQLVAQRGRVEPLKAAEYAAQVCAALSVAHGYGIIHRDIKSHNLVLTPDGTVKVMDFGIARAVNSTMTQTGSVLGTAQYVSPEQAQGRALTPATDLYSLGIVLFELATGTLPFEGETPVTVALKHVNEPAPAARSVDPEVPPALEAIISRAMEKDVARRYASADEMRDDLLRFVQGRPVGAAPRVGDTTVMPPVAPATPVEVRRAPQRKRGIGAWVWVLAVILALAAGLGAAWAFGLFSTDVQIPTAIQGMPVADAKAKLEELGLVAGNVDEKPDEAIGAGKVIATDPALGTPVPKGQIVDLTVSTGAPQVKVRDVVGLSEDEAIRALQADGFQIALPITREFNPKSDPGTVYQQDPAADARTNKGVQVRLWVSKGAEEIPVPYVVDKKKADAISELQKAGFKVKAVDKPNSDVVKGIVFDQKPAGGGTAAKGSEIVITVSSGPEMVTVPDVKTMSEADAKAKLTSVGLLVDVQPATETDPTKVGKVTGQLPAAGETALKGSTVTIQVGVAP